MGKKQVHVIVVPKWVTLVLLVLTSSAMAALVWYLAGRAYASESSRGAVAGLLLRVLSPERASTTDLLAVLMPVFANVLLFVPWGFLAFLVFDRPERPRSRAYALTLAGGVGFALAVQIWQSSLPTRVSTPADSVANAAGAMVGAALGHLRKRVHVRFDH